MSAKNSPPPPITRFGLRTILTQLTAAAVIATAVSVGAVAYLNATATVKRLSTEVFKMEADYASARVVEYSSSARHILELNSALLSDHIVPNDVKSLGLHFIDVIRANPRLSSSGFGSPDGNAMWVTTDPTGQIQIHAYTGNGTDNHLRRSYKVINKEKWELSVEEPTTYNGNKRPWFLAALSSNEHEPVWTEPYLFIPEFVPGISLTQQVYDQHGTFLGVTFVDFEFRFLSRALEELHNDRIGAQAVIFDEAGNVLAHTNPESTSRLNDNNEMQTVQLSNHDSPIIQRLASQFNLPKTADELEGEISHINIDGSRFVVVIHQANLVQERTSLDWHVAVIVPEALILEEVRTQAWLSLLIGAVVLLIVIILAIFISERVTNSFYGFFNEMQRLGSLDLGEHKRRPTRIREVHNLAHNLDNMRKGLRSFERYVSSALVRELMSKGIEAKPGGQDQDVTILFTDVEGFTTISEGLKPHDLAVKLSHNLEETSQIIDAHKGTVDKFIGDSVMAFWNAPNPVPDHAFQACQAALEIMERVHGSATDSEPLWPIRIGINTATALVGNLGSLSRLDYTVIGDGVNLASRIEGINKQYGTRILVGENTKQAVENQMLTRPIDRVIVKGQSRAEAIHELMAERAKANQEQADLAEATERAFTAYNDENWDEAKAMYTTCLTIRPNDPVSLLFIQRCEERATA